MMSAILRQLLQHSLSYELLMRNLIEEKFENNTEAARILNVLDYLSEINILYLSILDNEMVVYQVFQLINQNFKAKGLYTILMKGS